MTNTLLLLFQVLLLLIEILMEVEILQPQERKLLLKVTKNEISVEKATLQKFD